MTLDLEQISYADFITEKVRIAAHSICADEREIESIVTTVRELISPWGENAIGNAPEYRSFVTDCKGLPFEPSVNFSKTGPELRLMWEALGYPAGEKTCADPGGEVIRRLAGRPGVSLDRYLKVEDLFMPTGLIELPAKSTVWIMLMWRPGEVPKFKAYMYAQHRGPDCAAEVVGEAFNRVGLARPWSAIRARYDELLELGYTLPGVALELTDDPRNRFKLYFAINDPSLAKLEQLAGLALKHSADRLVNGYRTLCGRQDHFGPVPISFTANLSLVEGYDRPLSFNGSIPIVGTCDSDPARTEEVARERFTRLLASEGVNPARYRELLQALSSDHKFGSALRHAHFALRTDKDTFDASAYLHFPVWSE